MVLVNAAAHVPPGLDRTLSRMLTLLRNDSSRSHTELVEHILALCFSPQFLARVSAPPPNRCSPTRRAPLALPFDGLFIPSPPPLPLPLPQVDREQLAREFFSTRGALLESGDPRAPATAEGASRAMQERMRVDATRGVPSLLAALAGMRHNADLRPRGRRLRVPAALLQTHHNSLIMPSTARALSRALTGGSAAEKAAEAERERRQRSGIGPPGPPPIEVRGPPAGAWARWMSAAGVWTQDCSQRTDLGRVSSPQTDDVEAFLSRARDCGVGQEVPSRGVQAQQHRSEAKGEGGGGEKKGEEEGEGGEEGRLPFTSAEHPRTVLVLQSSGGHSAWVERAADVHRAVSAVLSGLAAPAFPLRTRRVSQARVQDEKEGEDTAGRSGKEKTGNEGEGEEEGDEEARDRPPAAAAAAPGQRGRGPKVQRSEREVGREGAGAERKEPVALADMDLSPHLRRVLGVNGVPTLRALLRSRGVSDTGSKEDMVARAEDLLEREAEVRPRTGGVAQGMGGRVCWSRPPSRELNWFFAAQALERELAELREKGKAREARLHAARKAAERARAFIRERERAGTRGPRASPAAPCTDTELYTPPPPPPTAPPAAIAAEATGIRQEAALKEASSREREERRLMADEERAMREGALSYRGVSPLTR